MSHGKEFTLFLHKTGPNGWKVVFVLEALNLSYECVWIDFKKNEHRAPEFTKYNPNGRIPALIDHKNNDFVIWESVAIMIYLAETYDVHHKISVTDGIDKYKQLQWLIFQASGQGPYFGQAYWFRGAHPEKIQSAIDRYKNEIRRVFSVLDGVLAKQDYLVGDKVTIADLAFVGWNVGGIEFLGAELDFEKEYPATAKWHNMLMAFDAVKKSHDYKDIINAPIAV